MNHTKPAIHQLLTSISYGDAIGNYALHIQEILRKRGYASDIFVELIDPRMAGKVKRLEQYLPFSSPDAILIFHFSIGSQTSRLAYHLPDKKILIYHNITPHTFFEFVHPHLSGLLYHGRRELKAFSDRCILALGDSEFNRRELEASGFPSNGVLPISVGFEALDAVPNRVFHRLLEDGKKNFLFVGRVIPNKKFEDLIKVFSYYRECIDHNVRLILAGEFRGFERYYDALQALIHTLKLEDVLFTGHIHQDELVACYRAADLFLCMSEHEGFCVPILEAFHCNIPVIAYAAGAVPATMHGGGLLVNQKDFSAIAETAALCMEDENFRQQVLRSQDKALRQYLTTDWEALFYSYIDRVARHGN